MKVVCIGGGLGAPTVMAGLRAHTEDITGLIAVSDSGRSTGTVRIALDVPAPGPRELWNKVDTIRHDPAGVADALMALVADRRPRLRALS